MLLCAVCPKHNPSREPVTDLKAGIVHSPCHYLRPKPAAAALTVSRPVSTRTIREKAKIGLITSTSVSLSTSDASS